MPDAIWELSAMRKMADPRLPPPALASLTRSLGRTQSGPLPFGSTSHPRANPRTFSRSLSSSLGHSSPEAVKTAVPLQLDLSKNNLTASSISHALFTLDNLKYLFLRQNQLERLPAGIGRLRGLEELSLSGNQLQYLPAEILRLDRLIKLRLHPNPFLQPPPPSTASGDGSYRTLGDLVVHFRVPSLLEACTRYLLEADAPSASPNILGYEIPTELADHLRLPFHTTLNPPNTTSSSTSRLPRRQRQRTTSTQSYLSSSTSSFSSSSATSSNSTAFDEECDEDLPFDPLANVCRSPAHQGVEKRFYRPAVERIEWVVEGCLTVEGRLARAVNTASRIVPLRHRGCGVRCLDWLEEPVEEVESEASDSAEGE